MTKKFSANRVLGTSKKDISAVLREEIKFRKWLKRTGSANKRALSGKGEMTAEKLTSMPEFRWN